MEIRKYRLLSIFFFEIKNSKIYINIVNIGLYKVNLFLVEKYIMKRNIFFCYIKKKVRIMYSKIMNIFRLVFCYEE